MKVCNCLGHKLSLKALLFCFGLMMCKDVFSAAPDEYTLKLVYLYNFTKFINWPPAEQGEHEEPYKICIMGSIPASNALKQLEQKRSKNRLITTSRRSVDQNADDCHILFITKNISRSDVSRVLASPLENTVIVGETNAFAKQAGDIGFVIDDNNHVTIEINLNNTQNKNVNIRAPLLEIARKVYRAEEQE